MDKLVSLLLLLCVMLTPFARSAEIPLILLSILGLLLVIKQRADLFALEKIKKFSLLFLLLWLPIIISAVDSINQGAVVGLAAEYLRFYFFGVLVIYHLDDYRLRNRVVTWVSLVLLFWIGDALIQALFGIDLFGLPLQPRLSGIFGRHLKLGLYLSVYAPLLMIFSDRFRNKYVKALVFIALVLVVLLAGSRGGWIMLGVASLGYAGVTCLRLRRVPVRAFALFAVLIAVIGTLCYLTIPSFTARFDRSLQIFKGDRASIDTAISLRLPIWTAAVEMFEDHPLNGVGARNFRYTYKSYARPDDIFVRTSKGKFAALHAHTMILDVASETGIIGLMGLTGFCGLLILFWLKSNREQKLYAAPFALGLLAALFPLNTHFDFYSGAWTQVIFWYTALYIATIHSANARDFCPQDAAV